MVRANEPKLESFFASRAGVCVYVTVQKRIFRVQFSDASAHGVIVEGAGEGAEQAREIARRAMLENASALAPLFEKVARALT